MEENRQTVVIGGTEDRSGGTYQDQHPEYHAQAYQYNKQESIPPSAKRQAGFLKKICFMCILGLIFGVCSAVAFYAVYDVRNAFMHEQETQIVTQNSESTAAEAESDKPNMLQASNVTTTVVTDVTEVVEQVMPSIVSITNNYTYSTYYYDSQAQESGSGIIIGEDEQELLIATNYHVIENAEELTVTFSNNSEADAVVKGRDSSMDLAVIAVNIADLDDATLNAISVAKLGDSDSLKVGEPVIAIGNALGYGQSVTTGVISAMNREIDMNGMGGTFLQTDAAINPGNSGGALLNISGEVIGINSNKIGGSTVEGMGYAIPISAAEPIIEDLVQRETRVPLSEDEQGYLGISGATITPQERAYYGYPNGVYVANVYQNSPAAEAGIKQGDFITSVNGEEVFSMEELQQLLSTYEGGTTVEIGVSRVSANRYRELSVDVTLQYKSEISFH